MGNRNTSLVDTDISRVLAPKGAHGLYERLVAGGVIFPELRDDLPLTGAAFALRDDFRCLDDLEGPGLSQRPSDSMKPKRTRVTAIDISVTGYGWRTGPNGRPELVVHSNNNGLFMNFDGGFTVNCPSCRSAVELGTDGSEGLYDALDAWCQDPESSQLRCMSCNASAPLSAWQSDNHEFAAGHLGLTLWGEHLLGVVERPSGASTKLLKSLFSGSDGGDPAVVFCNI